MTGPRAPVRAVVLGDDSRVRHAMAGLLRAGGDLDVVDDRPIDGVAAEPAAAAPPDLIVIDMGDREREKAVRLIGDVRVRYQGSTVVVVGDPVLARHAGQAGADGYVSRLEPPRSLADAVRAARRSSPRPATRP